MVNKSNRTYPKLAMNLSTHKIAKAISKRQQRTMSQYIEHLIQQDIELVRAKELQNYKMYLQNHYKDADQLADFLSIIGVQVKQLESIKEKSSVPVVILGDNIPNFNTAIKRW